MKTLLSRFTFPQVFALICAAVLITATVWGASSLANRMDYQVVSSDVDPAETQQSPAEVEAARPESERLESELASKIVQILEPAVGQGKVRPQVSVRMNFQQVEETTEHYDPQTAVVRSEQKQEEHSSSTAGEHPVIKTQTLNYEVNKAVRHTVEPAGRVESISVAVIVDNRSKTITRTPEEMQKYREIVSAAIGFNAERGDKLTLENISFEGDVDPVQKPGFLEKHAPVLLASLRFLIIPTAFILIYFVLLRPMKTFLLTAFASSPAPIPFAAVQKPITVKQLEAQLANPKAPEREIMPQPGQSKMEAIRDRVIEQASQNPENVARMVRVWLNERSK